MHSNDSILGASLEKKIEILAVLSQEEARLMETLLTQCFDQIEEDRQELKSSYLQAMSNLAQQAFEVAEVLQAIRLVKPNT
jgi:hypothetical protein